MCAYVWNRVILRRILHPQPPFIGQNLVLCRQKSGLQGCQNVKDFLFLLSYDTCPMWQLSSSAWTAPVQKGPEFVVCLCLKVLGDCIIKSRGENIDVSVLVYWRDTGDWWRQSIKIVGRFHNQVSVHLHQNKMFCPTCIAILRMCATTCNE